MYPLAVCRGSNVGLPYIFIRSSRLLLVLLPGKLGSIFTRWQETDMACKFVTCALNWHSSIFGRKARALNGRTSVEWDPVIRKRFGQDDHQEDSWLGCQLPNSPLSRASQMLQILFHSNTSQFAPLEICLRRLCSDTSSSDIWS